MTGRPGNTARRRLRHLARWTVAACEAMADAPARRAQGMTVAAFGCGHAAWVAAPETAALIAGQDCAACAEDARWANRGRRNGDA